MLKTTFLLACDVWLKQSICPAMMCLMRNRDQRQHWYSVLSLSPLYCHPNARGDTTILHNPFDFRAGGKQLLGYL